MYPEVVEQSIEQKYGRSGHPSIEELKLAQGTIPTSNPRELLGDFWPESENIDEFLATVRKCRGHMDTDQAPLLWNGEEIIRIISARRAQTHDLRRYQAQAVD